MEARFISLESARKVLQPRMQALTDALSQCEKLWNNELAFTQRTLDESARAHVLNQYWYAYARAIFAADNGVVVSKNQLQRYVVIDEQIIIRFKFLDRNLCASNYPTDRAINWSLQMPLEGYPLLARLHYGYRMDITGTRVKDAFVTLPYGTINEWVWQTSGERIDTYAIQIRLRQAGELEPKVFAYDNYHLGE